MSENFVVALTVPRTGQTGATSYNLRILSIDYEYSNKILQVDIAKSPAGQGSGYQPVSKIVDLKKVSRTFSITGRIPPTQSSTAYAIAIAIAQQIESYSGSVSGTDTTGQGGNHQLVVRGTTYYGIVTKFKFNDNASILQNVLISGLAAAGNMASREIPFTMNFTVTKRA